MTQCSSRTMFDEGVAAISRGLFLEALAYFELAVILSQRCGVRPPVKYLSYYGLALAMACRRVREAREICEGAAEGTTDDPDLFLNLGKVCLEEGNRARAFDAFVRGLQIDGRHQGLIGAMHQLGFRRRRVLRFLDRQHPLNRLLGTMRAAVERRTTSHAPAR